MALTAKWEQQLADMVDGNVGLETFESEIAGFLRELLPIVTSQGALLPAQAEPDFGQCPQCGQGVVRPTPKGGGCSRWQEGCKFAVWREQYGKQLTDNQLAELVTHRRTKVISGFKKKDGSGSTYAARLVLNEEFRVKLEFGDSVVGSAPALTPKSEPAEAKSHAGAPKRERTIDKPSSQPPADAASGVTQVTAGLLVDQASGLIVWQDEGEQFSVTITSYEARMLSWR